MAKAILFSATRDNFVAEAIEVEEKVGLQTMYDNIGCDTVDVVRLPNNIDVWVDDEGLLKSGNVVMDYLVKENKESEEFSLQLAGNALLLSYDNEGNSLGLSDEQIKWIQNNIQVRPYGITK